MDTTARVYRCTTLLEHEAVWGRRVETKVRFPTKIENQFKRDNSFSWFNASLFQWLTFEYSSQNRHLTVLPTVHQNVGQRFWVAGNECVSIKRFGVSQSVGNGGVRWILVWSRSCQTNVTTPLRMKVARVHKELKDGYVVFVRSSCRLELEFFA